MTHDPRIMDIADRVAYLWKMGFSGKKRDFMQVSGAEQCQFSSWRALLASTRRIDHKHNERAPG